MFAFVVFDLVFYY